MKIYFQAALSRQVIDLLPFATIYVNPMVSEPTGASIQVGWLVFRGTAGYRPNPRSAMPFRQMVGKCAGRANSHLRYWWARRDSPGYTLPMALREWRARFAFEWREQRARNTRSGLRDVNESPGVGGGQP